ncbi:TAXI family TRAP transporter solute-binding subunit [bacterium]|nr:TAXI family TRAP transporter solute-binding subunit [bacterium]
MRRILVIILALSLLFTISCGGGGEKTKKVKTRFISIGTGGVTGVYYPVGGVIAKMLNDKSDEYGLKATVEATGGSVFNINSVMAGDLDFGIAQSDRQYQAINGLSEWEGKPQPTLRSVFSLHSEAVTLIASDPSGIVNAADMRGKRIAIGNPGSGHRGNALDALRAYNLTLDDILPEDIKPAECAGMLQDGRIDAYFYTVGHPNGSIKEAVAGKTIVHFVPLNDVKVLLKEFPYYARTTINVDQYTGVSNTENVKTFGVKATLVTNESVDEDIVYTLTKEVLDNFDEFIAQHAAFTGLTRVQMLDGLSAPLHPGAARYFKESGLLDEKEALDKLIVEEE